MITNTLVEQVPGTKIVGGFYKDVKRSTEILTRYKKKIPKRKRPEYVQLSEKF